MTLPSEPALHKLQFYVTTPYACGYLPNQLAQSLIATPHHLVDANLYSGLIQQGFRRSGKFAYRPHCENCNACIAVRVVLPDFLPNRSQKRAFKQHADLTARVMPLGYHDSHFGLYTTYQAARHPDEHVKKQAEAHRTAHIQNEADEYRHFLCQSNVESLMVEFSDANNQVKIVSVIDIVNDGVSAVYTFYDTTQTKASYGTYSIMWLIEWTNMLGLPYFYLGYWIAESQKMAYKQAFKPQEKLIDGEWI
ncbi:MAG: arginyltransferase [Bdellovibrio sp.]|nr:arginyltransferase [Methylotenera sp.]